jgi:predicted transcriptional regulator
VGEEGDMAIADEDIEAGDSVVLAFSNGKAYVVGSTAGVYIGNAVTNIRAGFRISVKHGDIREDDA